MLADLTVGEYESAKRCFVETPFGPYIDLVNNARLLMPYVEKGTPIKSIMTSWDDGRQDLEVEEMETMIYENENFGDFLSGELSRLSGGNSDG